MNPPSTLPATNVRFLRLIMAGFFVTVALISSSILPAQVRIGISVHHVAARAAQWKDVVIPYHREGLSPAEQQMVTKLADACRLMDEIYWHQSDLAGLAVYHGTQNAVVTKLFEVMGSRWDLLDDNAPFIGDEPMPPGHELYPHSLKREQIEQDVKEHPVAKDALYNPWTVVRGTPDHLTTVPYHEAFAEWVQADGGGPACGGEAEPGCGVRALS